ncbi:MAG: glutamine--fructose-6-phosphate transaminase (isomerizing) [Bacteroidales bacterium]|jgi:glucosamine--fructose-6-phosphate aminotransferase (isomerizing)|nr:glutamine--fructose-6-phosphate transaminase (isomerizing) [Bacteroidales bacterium]
MCGIVGYIGDRTAWPIIIKGLQRLEYRGYDSAGIAVIDEGKLRLNKCRGRVSDLQNQVKGQSISGSLGIGHTRWATHGEPNDINAHPHVSMNGKIVVVHNGIIENYRTIRKSLQDAGYTFKGETDTEVLADFIEYIYMTQHVSAEQAIKVALNKVIGAYGLGIICTDEPDKLFGARKGSPLAVGVGQGEYFMASDATPIVEYTDKLVYLEDEQVVVLTRQGMEISDLKDVHVDPVITKIEFSADSIDKGGYEHFMLKEIHEQPNSLADTMRGRIVEQTQSINLGGISEVMPKLVSANRIIIVACGTSYHAGLVGEYLFEQFARINVEVEYASEFRYRDPIISEEDVVLVISQSGETADTLAALRMAKEKGATVIGICNVVGSSIARETHAGIYTHAGPEIGVASTKAFTSQVVALTMMALAIGRKRGKIEDARYSELISGLLQLPELVERVLKGDEHIKEVSRAYQLAQNAIYLGRGYLFPVALEGALKLKEISYIHAEGYPAAEMKHGPIALIDNCMPVFVLATRDKYYDKVVNNIQEVKARKGQVVAIVTEGDTEIARLADYVIEIPECDEALLPMLAVVPLQLISYHIAVMRRCDVDQPRNLAKSVTVE